MGCGPSYSRGSYDDAYKSRGFDHKDRDQLFAKTGHADTQARSFNTHARTHNVDVRPEMLSVGVRESRNIPEHPHVFSMFIGLDNTGSMIRIPEDIIKNQFPHLMDGILELGIKDPQLLFMAIGDHYTDSYPIQVGQFESETGKILDSIQQFYLEGHGGGNGGESYLLAWIMAGYHTELDCWYKDKRKGFLFTIGDEPTHESISGDDLTRILGYEKGAKEITAVDALKKAQEQYEVFHIHMTDASHSEREVRPGWEKLLGDHFLTAKSKDLNKVILETVHKYYKPVEEEAAVESVEAEDAKPNATDAPAEEGKHQTPLTII